MPIALPRRCQQRRPQPIWQPIQQPLCLSQPRLPLTFPRRRQKPSLTASPSPSPDLTQAERRRRRRGDVDTETEEEEEPVAQAEAHQDDSPVGDDSDVDFSASETAPEPPQVWDHLLGKDDDDVVRTMDLNVNLWCEGMGLSELIYKDVVPALVQMLRLRVENSMVCPGTDDVSASVPLPPSVQTRRALREFVARFENFIVAIEACEVAHELRSEVSDERLGILWSQ